MFGLGLPEILVILVIIFLLFGAKRIPEIGTGLGKTIREIKKIRDERKADKEKDKPEKEKEKESQKRNLISDLKKGVEDIPGLKEAREIKETADKVKNIMKILK